MCASIRDGVSPVNRKIDRVSSNAREVYKLIHGMTRDEIIGLRSRTAAILSDDTEKPSRPSTVSASDAPVDWLLAGIEEELRGRGLLGRSSRLPVSRICPKYESAARPVMDLLARSMGGRPRPHDLAALGVLVAECLAEYLEGMKIPVCPRTMLQNAGDAAAAVDASFPGYVQRGMIRTCLGS